MMVGKDDLGLSLSLGPHSSSPHHFRWPADLGRGLKGFDVNRAPPGAGDEEEAAGASSSPNSAASSVLSGGKRGADHHEEINCSDDQDADADADGDGSKKKLRLSKDQSAVLEESFKEHNTLNPKQKVALAKKLRLRARQVEVWFQNRRARTKLKQTEVDCGFLKRCCESLTEENRRLHKEVQELRALKLSPHSMFMHMTPPTTLTMCPSCERISPASSSASPHHHHYHRCPPIAAVASFLDASPQRS